MLSIMVFIDYVCQVTTAVPIQVGEKKKNPNSNNINLNLSSFLATEGEEAVTPLGSGWFPKILGQGPRPSVKVPCSSLLSLRGKIIINYRKT